MSATPDCSSPSVTFDTSLWTDLEDLYEDILTKLHAEPGHGRSIGAIVDSVIWGGVLPCLPPGRMEFINVESARPEIKDELHSLKKEMATAVAYALANQRPVNRVILTIA